ncbi:hypothetical protein HPB48_013560 [Haemaphysalis longicornis]|uniref:Tick transposon n=1 Tax=Haemaphysalis longicornis TaxID=44386 RepID=A0A9J6GLM9_HAELO|nr:hypothetical protein HPB48_013560 [Haemaphysalis longicornis]
MSISKNVSRKWKHLFLSALASLAPFLLHPKMPWKKIGPPKKYSRSRGETIVWQWNCRGFREKRSELIQYITTHETPPHVVALQESNTHASLPGYITFHADGTRVLHTLVSRSITAIQPSLPLAGAPGVLLELLPAKASKISLPIFHLNIYFRPKCYPQAINDTLELARKLGSTNSS